MAEPEPLNIAQSFAVGLLGAGLIIWLFASDWRYAVAGVIGFVMMTAVGGRAGKP